MATQNKIWFAVILVLIMAFCFISGYADGRWIGEAIGYQEGYGRAMAIVDDYPQATFEGYTISIDGGGTFSFGELTVVGEQSIIDMVSNAPIIKRTDESVEIKQGDLNLVEIRSGTQEWTVDGEEVTIIPDEVWRMNAIFREMD